MDRLKELWDEYRHECLIGLCVVIAIVGFILKPGSQFKANQSNQFAVSSSTRPRTTSHALTGKIMVDVKGAVKAPGLYKLGKGARVQEALVAAGGHLANADMNQVNLAKQLTDAQVVYVPKIGEQMPVAFGGAGIGTEDGSGAPNSSSGPIVNLNSATKDQLQTLTGIGDKKADLIIAYRQAHGSFKSVDDLKNVQGFGDKTVAKLKDQLAV